MTLKKIIMLVCVAGYALSRGCARQAVHSPEHILIVQMAKLGDMVCTTPLFRAAKERYPEVRVSVLGNKVNREVLQGNADIDEYIVFDGTWSVLKKLRSRKFDAACLAGAPDSTSLALTFLAGIPMIVAPRVVGADVPLADIWYRALCSFVCTETHTIGSYAPREYLRLLEPLDIRSRDTRKHLFCSDSARLRAESFVEEHHLKSGKSLVGIVPCAGNKVKEWPLERFVTVADGLVSRGARVVLVGGPHDREAGEQLRTASSSQNIANACGVFSIDESKALIASLDLLVGVDTGPLYIAEAFGVPTVDIVGPVDEREQPPQGLRHMVVLPPLPREPQLHVMNAHPRDVREARRQIEAITSDTVLAACEPFLRHA